MPPETVPSDGWGERVREALEVEECGADGPRAVADVDPKRWHEAVRTCRDELGCDFFDWLSAVDEGPGEAEPQDGEAEPAPKPLSRMRIVAHLWSVAERRGVLLRTVLMDGALPTITDLYPGASWHERETHEMFGVDFPGHPDLAPLLLAPEFEGHPLRKDFVLASRVVKPWPGEKEPGGGRPGAKKRAPKRPPGVPEGWMESEESAAAAPEAGPKGPRAEGGESARKPASEKRRAAPAPDPGRAGDAEPGGAAGADA